MLEASDASFETPISVVPDLVEVVFFCRAVQSRRALAAPLQAVSVHPGLGVKMSGKRLRFGAMPQACFKIAASRSHSRIVLL